MGKHETITAEISEEMATIVRAAVASGDYADVADVVRHALAEWRAAELLLKIRPDELDAMLDQALAGEEGVEAEAFFDQLDAELDGLIEDDRRSA